MVLTCVGFTDFITMSFDEALHVGLKSAAFQQPISVTVNAGQFMQFYNGGVVTGDCLGQINHAVMAVGYGVDGQKIFEIRNSWGASWGESGYIQLFQH